MKVTNSALCIYYIFLFKYSREANANGITAAPASDTPNQPSLIIYIIMSPCRKNANRRPAEPLLTLFAKHTLVMNKARLQKQTGAGRLVPLTMNIQCEPSQPGSLLICCKLAPYVLSLLLHMNDCKHGAGEKKGGEEVGDGMNIDDASVGPGLEGRGGRRNGACHSNVTRSA